MKRRLSVLSQKVKRIFKRIDASSSEVQLATGVRCKSGCGECCLSSKVEAMPIELIPLALFLLKQKKLQLYLSLAERLKKESCIFYSPNPFDPHYGQCGVYSQRPSLCRLFGFSARKDKYGNRSVAFCHWHKKLQPEAVAQSETLLESAQVTPSYLSEYHFQLQSLSPSPSLNQLLPINEAFVVAAKRVFTEQDDFRFLSQKCLTTS